MNRIARLLIASELQAIIVLAFCLSKNLVFADNQADWDRSGYHLKLHLAVDTTGQASSDLATSLAGHLKQRIEATLYPFWTVEISLSEGAFRYQMLTQLEELTAATTTTNPTALFDKQFFLSVTPTLEGYTLQCRELDKATQMLGPVLSQDVKQSILLPEHCFKLLCETFAPLAKVRRLEEDPQHVTLQFKGNLLSNQANHPLFLHAGDIYQPLRIRMTRTGEVREGGISSIPWTYLEFENTQDTAHRSKVHSAIQHPFGVRRRGRVEHIAIALRQPPAMTRVRFYAQHNKSQSLMGYEVFRREPDSEKSQLIGLTDNQGIVEVLPGSAKITILFLRSSNELLAKVPVVPGVLVKIDVPIADDIARLNAQATLTSLREQLIDLVARRNILIARVRDRIEESSYEEARDLLNQLDELPGRAQFAQSIASAQNSQRNRSDEPRIQARIDKMFTNTRKLLGRFLDTRPISELQDELNADRNNNQS